MTLLELRNSIKQEARVKVSTNLDDMINQIIWELLRDYGNKARYREVLQIDTPITLVAAQATYALPVDFQHMQSMRYSVQGTQFTPLYEFNEGFVRISDVGYPRYWQLSADGIMVFPSSQILTTNTLFISYYSDPSASYLLDADAFPIPRLEGAVKKGAIARVLRYMQNLDESNVVVQDRNDSFVAGQGGQ